MTRAATPLCDASNSSAIDRSGSATSRVGRGTQAASYPAKVESAGEQAGPDEEVARQAAARATSHVADFFSPPLRGGVARRGRQSLKSAQRATGRNGSLFAHRLSKGNC